MQPAAIGLMIAGFIFAFFSIPVPMGGFSFDLLIDAVGWLLVLNGLQGLRRAHEGFKGGRLVCFGLVVVCTLQLFFDDYRLILVSLRALLEILLFLRMSLSFSRTLRQTGNVYSLLARAVFLLNALGTLAWWILRLTARPYTGFAYDVFERTALLIFHLALIALLVALLVPPALARLVRLRRPGPGGEAPPATVPGTGDVPPAGAARGARGARSAAKAPDEPLPAPDTPPTPDTSPEAAAPPLDGEAPPDEAPAPPGDEPPPEAAAPDEGPPAPGPVVETVQEDEEVL